MLSTTTSTIEINPARAYTLPEVRELTGLSEYMLNKFIQSGQILAPRSRRKSGHRRVMGSAIIKFQEGRRHGRA